MKKKKRKGQAPTKKHCPGHSMKNSLNKDTKKIMNVKKELVKLVCHWQSGCKCAGCKTVKVSFFKLIEKSNTLESLLLIKDFLKKLNK